MNFKRQTGNLGEEQACFFLKKRGFEIVARNYLKKWGEIDIVAQNKGVLHFIEVKTVSRENKGSVTRESIEDYEPEDNLHPWKLKRFRRVIETYLLDKKVSDDTDWQVDAISVYLLGEGTEPKIDYLEDILI